ncbi:cytochrome P450 [Xylaria bambusicola]|uniref:cytochrome P450 n=1 Tax=Xylaria bambusicola TaxID=326684 RepID=UPI0020080EE9|nr:cytochrome P450 [Xylaria bambusicola]KAI0503173.1 cytochrome P450 [Xylaria bambusicola]
MASYWELLCQSEVFARTAGRNSTGSSCLEELLDSGKFSVAAAIIVSALFLIVLLSPDKPTISGAPVHGRRWWWEPTMWLQSRFTFGAYDIVTSGYRKYKDRPFVVKRFDINFNVLPNKHLEELRLVPETILDQSQVQNIGHKWTDTMVVTESRLHFRTVQSTLGTELSRYLDLAKAELDYTWELYMPNTDDWQNVDINRVVRMLVASSSARVFVGYPACRNEEWLKLSVEYTMDVFQTAFIIRLFPYWLQPIFALFIPARYRIAKQVALAYRVLTPLIKKHAEATRKRQAGENANEEATLLNWMVDHGTKDENKLDKIIRRHLLLTLASTHTTVGVLVSILFDMCAHPEWIPVLRQEIENTTKELGPIGSNPEISSKQWLQRLEKLDSFFNESRRVNPLVLLVPQRTALEPVTLKDGTRIPKGARICFASASHMNDASVTPRPEVFDPMRSYNKRHASPDQKNKHLADQTSPDNLTWGYGKLACPGRHFAVAVTKMILARLLVEYDFKFPGNVTSGPKVFFADELLFTDPTARIMMKRRRGE